VPRGELSGEILCGADAIKPEDLECHWKSLSSGEDRGGHHRHRRDERVRLKSMSKRRMTEPKPRQVLYVRSALINGRKNTLGRARNITVGLGALV
jgi:hypothetical protein